MIHTQLRRAPRGSLSAVVCAALVLSVAPVNADTDDPVFYGLRGPHPLIRSQTEFAVELASEEMADTVRASALDAVTGVLKPVPGMNRLGRFAILEVVAANRAARTSAQQIEGIVSARPVYRFEPNGTPFLSSGEIVVKLAPDLSDAGRAELFEEYELATVRAVPGLDNVYVVRPIGANDDEVEIAAFLHCDPRTLYAHPNFRVKAELRQSAPDDEFFPEQWHLDNIGQSGAVPGADISVLDAWDITRGEGVVMGVFDDAVDLLHEDLRDRYTGTSQDVLSGAETEKAAMPVKFGEHHGTSVTGLMCASANDIGVRGVAPEATFTCTRGLEESITLDRFALPFVFAMDQGVWVHNNSWGPGGITVLPPAVIDAIDVAFREGRNGLGMVILFASGNDGVELEFGDDPSTLPTVIGVGGSNAYDYVSLLSNYGDDIDVLAPTEILDWIFWEPDPPTIVTTDVEDYRYADDQTGFLILGYNDDFTAGITDLDNTSYTSTFNGTSAACPIASGVAGLILSANPNLTATQVRVLMEHTCDRIQDEEDYFDPTKPGEAEYDGITGRSLRYAYGRLNAAAAVAEAKAAPSYDPPNLTWPDRVANVQLIQGTTLVWERNDDLRGDDEAGDRTVEFVVAENAGQRFEWRPEDGHVYSVGDQVGANREATITQIGPDTNYTFVDKSTSIKYVAIYARNAIGRYSWGVEADSTGEVNGAARRIVEIPTGPIAPRVTVTASPLSGQSPLTVQFRGNAQTDSPITSQMWDFGDGTTDMRGTTSHTYTAAEGTTDTYEAKFTVVDSDGDEGSKTVLIHVTSDGASGNGNTSGEPSSIRIEVTDSNGAVVDTSIAQPAPFRVFLSVDLSNVKEFVPEKGVTWYFGDGSLPVTSRAVTHVYETAGQFPATVKVTTVSGAGKIAELSATEVILTEDTGNTNGNDNTNDNSAGGPSAGVNSGTCGIGIVLPFAGVFLMSLWRRRLR